MFKHWLLIAVISSFIACGGITKYEKEVLDFRALKNEQFRNASNSPLSKEQIAVFKGLTYFKPAKKFRFEAKFHKAKLPVYVNLFGEEKSQQIHQLKGKVLFEINGNRHSLNTYSSISKGKHQLFIPFRDLTNNDITYGGGRYVDAQLVNDSVCILDFNYSYNPYCVYNEKYSCALVPIENSIQDSILAGEMYILKNETAH